jgi:hypothetical protein
MRLVLKICGPVVDDHSAYVTIARKCSSHRDYGRRCTGGTAEDVSVGGLEGFGKLFPFLDKGGMGGLVTVKFLRLALAFFGADEVL